MVTPGWKSVDTNSKMSTNTVYSSSHSVRFSYTTYFLLFWLKVCRRPCRNKNFDIWNGLRVMWNGDRVSCLSNRSGWLHTFAHKKTTTIYNSHNGTQRPSWYHIMYFSTTFTKSADLYSNSRVVRRLSVPCSVSGTALILAGRPPNRPSKNMSAFLISKRWSS